VYTPRSKEMDEAYETQWGNTNCTPKPERKRLLRRTCVDGKFITKNGTRDVEC
jgi:hypothetical protein